MRRNKVGQVPDYTKKEIKVGTSDNWRTPQPLFDKLNAEFHFEVDLAADEFNHKCEKYYSLKDNAFNHSWRGNCFANIPYSRPSLWYEQAFLDGCVLQNGIHIVLLVKVATSENYWLYTKHADVRFLHGRIKFWDENNTPHYGATFGSALVIFSPESYNKPSTTYWDYRKEIPERLF